MFVRNTTQLNILYSETLDALIFFYYEAADEGPRSILTLLLGNLKVSCCPLLCCLVKVVATEVGERSHDATNQTLLYSSHLNHWQRCTRKQKKKKTFSALICLGCREHAWVTQKIISVHPGKLVNLGCSRAFLENSQ